MSAKMKSLTKNITASFLATVVTFVAMYLPGLINFQAGSAQASTILNIIPPCFRSDNAADAIKAQTDLTTCLIGSKSSPNGLTYWVDLLLVITMVAAFVYVLIGAFQMVTAYGDESKFTAGRKTLTYAIVGVVIATLALVIVNVFISLLGGTIISNSVL
jgi:hypothetical protein